VNPVTFLRRTTLLLAVSLAILLPAAELAKAGPGKEPAAEPTPADKEVLALPKVEVTSARIKQIDNELKKIDKQIARERKKLKSTDLDKSLNSDKVSNAAALFGGNSASHMAAVAASRVNLLESERSLLERLKFPRTEEDKAMIEKELVSLRTTRRNLDDAAKQR
jgi:paraquat-inducible protein B